MESGILELRDRRNREVEWREIRELQLELDSSISEDEDMLVSVPMEDSKIDALRTKLKGRALARELSGGFVYCCDPSTPLTISTPATSTDTDYTAWMW